MPEVYQALVSQNSNKASGQVLIIYPLGFFRLVAHATLICNYSNGKNKDQKLVDNFLR